MPIWVRALILGLSLIGYIIVCIYTLRRNYKECQSSEVSEEEAKKTRKQHTRFIVELSAILGGVFVFSFPTLIFLSYYKMLITIILIVVFSSALLSNVFKEKEIMLFIICVIITFGIMFGFFNYNLNNSIICTKTDSAVETITPSMFSENKIAYTCDNKGNISRYFYYYYDNGNWKYQEFDESELEVIKIKNEDTYLEKTTTTTECVNTEKRPSAKDYTFEKTKVKYNLFINYEQAVEITN